MTGAAPEHRQLVQLRNFEVRRIRIYLMAVGFSACLLGLAFPNPGWGILAHVALVPAALIALRANSSWRLVWTSYIVSFLWWLFMLRWLVPVTGSGLSLLAALMGIYLPATLLMFRWLRHWPLPATAALPMSVVTWELVRTYWPAGGFTWFMLGHSQAPYHPSHGVSTLIQLADVFGDHGVSFMVAMTNGVIVDLLTSPWYRPGRGRHMRMSRKLMAVVFLWAFCLGLSWGYGRHRISQAAFAGPTLSVSVVQTNVPQSNKRTDSPEQLEKDWQDLLALSRRAIAPHTKQAGQNSEMPRDEPDPEDAPLSEDPTDTQPTDLTQTQAKPILVWPETVVPGPISLSWVQAHQSSDNPIDRWRAKFHTQIQALAQELQVDLIVGARSVVELGPHGALYNSVYHYHDDGRQAVQRYDKIHLVPFGEYIPWVESSTWLKKLFIRYISPYDRDYTLNNGNTYTAFQIQNVRLVTPICFEDSVARVCRQFCYDIEGRKRADLLVNLTNDGWYWPVQRRQHLQIAVFRSIENRVPTARSVNCGISGFISSIGQVGPIVSSGQAGISSHQIQLDHRSTLTGRIGHTPATAVALASAVLAVFSRFRRRKNSATA